MKTEIDEVLRYIGADKNDGKLRGEAERIRTEILPRLNPRKITARFSVKKETDGFSLDGTSVIFKGKLIERTLAGSDGVFLFAASLGLESELLLRQYFAKDSLSGVICDGILSAETERFCDAVENEIKKEAARDGKETRKRISCGYGDFDIKHQKDFLRVLNAEKLLGVKLNDNFMMYPNKTVTALVAVKSAAVNR